MADGFAVRPDLLTPPAVAFDEAADPLRAAVARARADLAALGDVAGDDGWPMALTTSFDWVIAAYDIDRGLRIFPPHTSPDEDGASVWS